MNSRLTAEELYARRLKVYEALVRWINMAPEVTLGQIHPVYDAHVLLGELLTDNVKTRPRGWGSLEPSDLEGWTPPGELPVTSQMVRDMEAQVDEQ